MILYLFIFQYLKDVTGDRERAYILIRELIKDIRGIESRLKASVSATTLRARNAAHRFRNLVFSGRVFTYTDELMDAIQIGELTKLYRDAGLFLEIRGHDYWWGIEIARYLQDAIHQALKPPRKPIRTWPQTPPS